MALTLIFGLTPFTSDAEELTAIDINDNTALSALSFAVVKTMKNGDYSALSDFAHPRSGVLFSPQATVSASANKTFNASEISAFGTDTTVGVWGLYSGSGQPIEMIPAEYFASFVYDKEFISAPYIGINRIIRSGDALENIGEVFPSVRFVEFNIPNDTLSQAEDAGWDTLRLGFDEFNGRVWLTVVIRSASPE